MPRVQLNRLMKVSALAAATCLIAWPTRAAAQAVPQSSPADRPTLEQRLERLCEQLDKQREAQHIPGIAIAVVKDDQAILCGGFGLRDIENNLPATEDTLFAIGSTTKAFTATLIGMLMDEGKMSWDDSPHKFLPDFHIKDAAADEQLQIRDMLSHRSGMGSGNLLWYGGKASRAEILQAVGQAELTSPFREKFNYSNVMVLAAGEAAARAAGSDWDTLIAQRIFQPLGMTNSNTSIEIAKKSPQLSLGYKWDADKSTHDHKPMRNLDNIAPAGAINSCAKDMAQWIRFQLAKGAIGETCLISPERIEEMWTRQIAINADTDYALGWMVHQWNGRRLVEHSGGIDGFGTQVALLPDDGVGYALMTNVISSALQPMSVNMVFDALLGTADEAAPSVDPAAMDPYLGKYHFDALNSDVTVLVQNGKLALDVPGQMVFELKPPDDAGKWVFAMTDQIAVSFVRDGAEQVIGMKIYQAGLEFELPREGFNPPADLGLDEAQKYLGVYHSDELKWDVKVLHHNGRLAVDVPQQMVYDLHLPDTEGKWAFRAKKSIAVQFNTDETGAVASVTLLQDGKEFLMPRTQAAPPSEIPSLDDLLALQRSGYGAEHLPAIKTLRLKGTVTFAHQGIGGTLTMTSAGLDHFLQEIDLGKFGHIRGALNGEKAWSDSTFEGFEDLKDDQLENVRLQHPLIDASDWRSLFHTITFDRVDLIDGKKTYVIDVTAGKDVSGTIWLDAQTGLVVKEVLAVAYEGRGKITTTVTLSDYRDVEGVRVAMRISAQNDYSGRMDMLIEEAQTNVDLPEGTFAPKPPG